MDGRSSSMPKRKTARDDGARNSGGEPDRETVWKDFNEAVNMTPEELENWLASDESRSAGWIHEGEMEPVGHHSGRRIVAIKKMKKGDLDEEDFQHMRKVIGYVHRHLAQGGPEHDGEHSR